MNIIKGDPMIPGTVFSKEKMGNVTGMEFLNKIFFISDGIMFNQVKQITGLDVSTIQNWVRRGWVPNPVNKRYSKDTVARILIIIMLKKTMSLERIDALLKYINGTIGDVTDDIIPESKLYDYICRIIDKLTAESSESGMDGLVKTIEECVSDYEEKYAGARRRLEKALEIIVVSYYAVLLAEYAERCFDER
ncbi:MAG: DUF1836 domain-containing protein [Ruminococcaceae bacterium]|nr:DUF1836 domain-containing protein [Oscillospiraceae bacterium]